MNGNGVVRRADGAIEVNGALTFETVPQFFAGSGDWLDGGPEALTVDLKNVTRVDSAGVALMLEWRERARAAGRELRFANLPEQVRHIIRVSGLASAFV